MPAESMHSLRRTLFERLLPAMLALLLVGALAGYWVALRSATKAYDRALLDTAFALSEQLRIIDGELQIPLNPQARAVLLADKYDRIYYAVYDSDGRLLDGNPALPRPSGSHDDSREGRWYYDGEIAGEPIRLAALQRHLGPRTVTLLAAETLVKRRTLVREILFGMLIPELLLAGVSAAIIWFGVRSGLRPLDRLRNELSRRTENDLSAVETRVPNEIQPVVTEINGVLQRLEDALASQRHFVANAAHQLRTPIAALLAQVEAADPDNTPGLAGIHAATVRMAHTVDQLLMLARADAERQPPFAPLELKALIQHQADNWMPRAIARRIDLGFALHEAKIAGNALLIEEMIANLVDNALRYTPQGGIINVSCGRHGEQAFILVEDSGPGIPADERERIGERFYRPAEQGGDGCGLGLAIVRDIVRSHDGRLTIGSSQQLGGAAMCIDLPAAG